MWRSSPTCARQFEAWHCASRCLDWAPPSRREASVLESPCSVLCMRTLALGPPDPPLLEIPGMTSRLQTNAIVAALGAATGFLTFLQLTYYPDFMGVSRFVSGLSIVPGILF